MKKILGYSDEISVFPNEDIAFMVSSEEGEAYQASLVQIIHGDTSPDGPGLKLTPVPCPIDGTYGGRRQELLAGSYVVIEDNPCFAGLGSFSVQAMVWPTTPERGAQALVSRWDDSKKCGFLLGIDEAGALSLTLGDGSGRVETVSSGKALVAREWYLAAATFDAESGQVRIVQDPVQDHGETDDDSDVTQSVSVKPGDPARPLLMAAAYVEMVGARIRTTAHYNGKIDSPALAKGVLDKGQMERLLAGTTPAVEQPEIIARWDFADGITTDEIRDSGANRLHGLTVNMPVRAMKGHNWTGREMCWRHAENEYGAIHFHDDDVYDAGWEVDFTLTVPDGLKSGLYAVKVAYGEHEDYMPFVVKAKRGSAKGKNRACFLVPTGSYMAYANEHMPTDAPLAQLLTGQVSVLYPQDVFLLENRNYGASCYDTHSDGSGVCYSSRLRPILNMRPNYQSWLGGAGSSLWQFNADTHIIDWIDAMGVECDFVSDEDLHYEGLAAIEDYSVVLTGSHPEYHSLEMWDAMEAFKNAGGRLMYLGANGWYWRIAYHQTRPGVMEVRRAEDGIRAWAAEPGEYYHSFTGEYGGLWRRNARPPQMMAGTGFTAQGFDVSSYYRRQPDAENPRAAFIMEGIEEEIIGDFGLIGGGAAGLELDRADRLLGTPPNALVLASSEDHTDIYLVVCEELLINYPGLGGQENPLVRADIVFYELASGGAVFATSSIAWGGSLAHNNYKNNVSRMTENVLRRFMDPTPF